MASSKEKVGPASEDWESILLETSEGASISLKSLRGKLVLLRFFFSTCPSICSLESQQLAAAYSLWQKGRTSDEANGVVFLSLTIDPENDSREKLASYRSRWNEAGPSWIFARVAPPQLDLLLQRFGVVTGGTGPLDHRGRLYLLAPDGSYLRSYSTQPRLETRHLVEELAAAQRAFLEP